MSQILELPRRNAVAAEQALRAMGEKILQQNQRIDGLHAALAGLIARISLLEQAEARRQVAAIGHGPTEAACR